MEDKTFELIEKLYIKLVSFEEKVDERFDAIDKKFDRIENRLTKIEINQEIISDRISEAFEAIDTLSETNDKQHNEIMRELRGRIDTVESVVKRIAK